MNPSSDYLLDKRASTDLLRYVLTPAQMVENEYPLPSYMSDPPIELEPGWRETPKNEVKDEVESNTQVYSVDCEMVSLTSS